MCNLHQINITSLLMCFLVASVAVEAVGSTQEIAKLTASDAAVNDQFGFFSIAVSGDTVVAPSALDDNENGNDAGAAYVFERNAGGPDAWGEVAKLVASDGGPGDQFGGPVAIDGEFIVVAAVKDASRRGSAYIFQRAGGSWIQVGKLVASDGQATDEFGIAVAVSGERVAVGANRDDNSGGTEAGAIYIFERNEGGLDAWGQIDKITAPDPSTFDHFGEYIALNGDTLVTAVHLDDDNGTNSGSAYVFQRNTLGSWIMAAKLLPSDGTTGDQFGESIGISGDTVIVGNRLKVTAGTVSGAAYLFGRDAGGPDAWGQVAKLVASDSSPGDEFGFFSSINDDLVAVGARLQDGGGVNAGAVYVFGRNVNGPDMWGQLDKLIASDSAPGDLFGVSTAIDFGTLIVGASLDDDAGPNSGSAYVFSIDGDGDGVPDGTDQCTDSDTSGFLTIDGCETGVLNFIFNDGCTLSDLVLQCAEGAQTHGAFVSCVSHLTNELKSAGLISGREKGMIQRCVARADIP